jgi:hypothetical protein
MCASGIKQENRVPAHPIRILLPNKKSSSCYWRTSHNGFSRSNVYKGKHFTKLKGLTTMRATKTWQFVAQMLFFIWGIIFSLNVLSQMHNTLGFIFYLLLGCFCIIGICIVYLSFLKHIKKLHESQ